MTARDAIPATDVEKGLRGLEFMTALHTEVGLETPARDVA
jgi:hypothetical protein